MRIYLDDDTASSLLVKLLLASGHDIETPGDANLRGADDSVHLTYAIRRGRVLLSGNHDDFERLHDLVLEAKGHHSGILIVRRDNDARKDLTARGILSAINNLLTAVFDMTDEFQILNNWR